MFQAFGGQPIGLDNSTLPQNQDIPLKPAFRTPFPILPPDHPTPLSRNLVCKYLVLATLRPWKKLYSFLSICKLKIALHRISFALSSLHGL
ncbi:hypothetical protein AYI69_g1595 [Smittium culicis]|uniref:Uncharacterized protein n=1 Tax=Smittium culicis TaxID=133412 RepID=A0A1R1YPW1_9FUNG|nr:hypothetical protein AYI69_g1595 [Smittium culicis]